MSSVQQNHRTYKETGKCDPFKGKNSIETGPEKRPNGRYTRQKTLKQYYKYAQ